MACSERLWIDKLASASIVVGLEALELSWFLAVRFGSRFAGSIARQAVDLAIHDESLLPIL